MVWRWLVIAVAALVWLGHGCTTFYTPPDVVAAEADTGVTGFVAEAAPPADVLSGGEQEDALVSEDVRGADGDAAVFLPGDAGGGAGAADALDAVADAPAAEDAPVADAGADAPLFDGGDAPVTDSGVDAPAATDVVPAADTPLDPDTPPVADAATDGGAGTPDAAIDAPPSDVDGMSPPDVFDAQDAVDIAAASDAASPADTPVAPADTPLSPADVQPPDPATFVLAFHDELPYNTGSLHGTAGWSSFYCEDAWKSSDGVATALTDDGCGCPGDVEPPCGFGVGSPLDPCYASDPLDNFIANGNPGWSDVVVDVAFHNLDNDALGVAFRFESPASTYLVVMSNELWPAPESCYDGPPGTRLLQIMDGGITVLASSPLTYTPGEPGRLIVTAIGDTVTVELEAGDSPPEHLFTVDLLDPAPLAGRVALFAYQNGSAEAICKTGPCGFTEVSVFAPE